MKQLFIIAISIFIAATVMCMTASNFWLLLFGRLLQGIGTGIALPLMFNIVLEQAPYEKMRFIMGIASLVTAIAPEVGPSFDGLIVNALGWRMIFAFLLLVTDNCYMNELDHGILDSLVIIIPSTPPSCSASRSTFAFSIISSMPLE